MLRIVMALVDGVLLETDCSCCCCNRIEPRLMQMRRFVIFMTCACAFACVITLTLTVCTAYLYSQYAEKTERKMDHQSGSSNGVGESQIVSTGTYTPESKLNRRFARQSTGVKQKHKGHRNKENKCGKITSGSLNDTGISKKADHYVANFTDKIFPEFNYRNSDASTDCQAIPEWGGVLCRNRSFTGRETPLTLNVFKSAGWMGRFKESDNILSKMDNGIFVAKNSGLYLLYAQLLFHDLQPMEVFKIVHRHDGQQMHSLKCMDGNDYIDSSVTDVGNFRLKTCAIMGVILLDNKDTIEVVMETRTRLDLSENATYFGAVLLS